MVDEGKKVIEVEKPSSLKVKKTKPYGTGRRKQAVARVWLIPGKGNLLVNNKPYRPTGVGFTEKILHPLQLANLQESYDIKAYVKGGGLRAHVDAIVHGVTRAIVAMSPDMRRILKVEGLLTRDPRKKERKKYFHKKARKSTQFRKR